MKASALSMLALAVIAIALASLVVTKALFSWSPVVLFLQAGALCLMAWARMTFGVRSFQPSATPTPGGIVTRGPYRHIRHPIYSALCLFVWPAAIASGSAGALALALLASGGAFVRMLCEERLLVGAYPEYAAYARTTKRMIPRLFCRDDKRLRHRDHRGALVQRQI